jgi:hypothetical protein
MLSVWLILIVTPRLVGMQDRNSLHEPKPAIVLCDGDDGLTSRFCDAVENAFRRSPDFKLKTQLTPSILKVTIPTNLHWKRVGGKTQAIYAIEFSSADDQKIGDANGSCREDQLNICANQVLRRAREIR